MKFKNKYALFFFVILFLVIIVLAGAYYFKKNDIRISLNINKFSSPTPPPPTPTAPPTPTVVEYTTEIVSLPKGISQGHNGSFTWKISGQERKIKTTTVYYGTESTPGKLSDSVLPLNTRYTDYLKEFINGDYKIPLIFIGNDLVKHSGTLYARAYAVIDNRNYWSDEQVFTVKEAEGNKIKINNFPQQVKLNENAAFTWEITGPSATINYTAIVGAKDTKAENLTSSDDLSKTPFKELVKEFVSGSYKIPLVFVGNTVFPEYGSYYIRALGVINGKNIWSDEYTVSVQ